MNPTFIAVGEYANYILSEGKVYTHDNNRLITYALPEPINRITAGHPYGYAEGKSGALYMLTGDSPTFKKIADNINIADAYWNWAVAVGGDNIITIYRDGVKYSTLPKPVGNIVQLSIAHYILARTDSGDVWQYAWSSTPWKSGTEWQKSASAMASLQPTKMLDRCSWVTTSRNMFSAAIREGKPYAWCDSFGAKYIGVSAAQTPKDMSFPWNVTEPIKVIEASDITLHFITESGKLYGMGDAAVGGVGNGIMDPMVKEKGNWDMAWQELISKPVAIRADRKYTALSTGNSYGYRVAAQEDNGVWSLWGYGKNGLQMNGIRVKDDPYSTGSSSITEPRRTSIPSEITVVDTPTIKNMVAAGTYPPPEAGVPTPEPPVRKVVAILYDDGKWEKPAV